MTWQELFCGKKVTLVQLPPLRHITAHSTRDLASNIGPVTVSSTSCQPAPKTLVAESRVNIGEKRDSKRLSVEAKMRHMGVYKDVATEIYLVIWHFNFEAESTKSL